MSEAAQSPREAYLEFVAEGRFYSGRPDHETVELLQAIAAGWRSASQYFYAGYVLYQANHFAWGSEDAIACVVAALRDFETAVARAEATSLEGIASLRMWTTLIVQNYLGADPSSVRRSIRGLEEELAQRLLRLADETEDRGAPSGFLVQGFHLETDFAGTWKLEFPGFEVDHNVIRLGGNSTVLSIPSAFYLFVHVADYFAADAVAQACPEGFTSHGLLGWKAAVTGYLNPAQAVEQFSEAAAQFGQDTYDEEVMKRTGGWSSINLTLWAKYFRARAAVAEIVLAPERTPELLSRASAALVGTEVGWVNPQVMCFRALITALEQVFSGDSATAAADAKKMLLDRARFYGLDENDQLAIMFLDTAKEAFVEFQQSPARAIASGRLADALDILRRIPLIGSEVTAAVGPAIADAEAFGQQRSWMYRTIGSVKDERILQRLLLRLMQGQSPPPLYAQIRHGPIEYGKDIAVLVEVDGKNILKMYQVKVGDITKAVWSKAREELEEIFQVDISEVQLPVEPDDRAGILIFNGHLNPHVEPVVRGWLGEQRNDHHRSFEIVHLDAIVKWIIDSRLLSDLREALAELAIPVLGQP
jgi:hypothetical protein